MSKNNSNCKDPLPIIVSDIANRESYSYKAYFNIQDPNQELNLRFLSWNGNNAKEIEIKTNSLPKTEIMSIEVIKKQKCFSSDFCNELHIKTRHNKLASTPPGSRFVLNEEIDFNCTKVFRIDFSPKEVLEGRHIEKKCSNCYKKGGIIVPEVKGGKVLQGA